MKMSNWYQYYFLDSMSYQMEQSVFFYDSVMILIFSIAGFVFMIYFMISLTSFSSSMLIEDSMLESLWTCFPMILMVVLVTPSLRLLYLLEESLVSEILFKTVGHQWYWSYEYPQFFVNFDSYMLNSLDINEFSYRLLDVDNRVVLPSLTPLSVTSTSEDVLHCWTMPSWALKLDSIPGKMNQVKLVLSKNGISYGQCSEICGANHSFMPIVVEVISFSMFMSWVSNF
uniref:Cytochrome c oxidase subunit 2 n=1 Tax=Gnathostomula armata TaxID=231613 RepID=A0A0F6Q173_9BILA|nr:cytochrome c oxidase subunit 2 [Gnathostomula armata]AKD00024.1 cytochrome c oxidase subunit 2 [Gnathostomula armata]